MLSPPGESVAPNSSPVELTGAPTFAGSDHSELAKDMAWSLGAAGPDSEAHATSNATDSSASAVVASTDLMVTSWLMPARRAGGHVEVVAAGAPRPIGREDQRAPIEGEARRDVVRYRVQWRAQVCRRRPWVVHGLPGGYPQIDSAEPTGAGRPEHQLSAISADRDGGVVGARVAELDDELGGPEGLPVACHGRHVDVRLVLRQSSPIEVQVGRSVFRVLQVHGRLFRYRSVHAGAEWDGVGPAEVVVRVGSMRHEDVGRTTSSVACEKEPVAVAGQVGREIGARAVDRRAQVHGGLPGACGVVRIGAGALRHPDVEWPGPAGRARGEIEAETVSRERGVLLVRGGV